MNYHDSVNIFTFVISLCCAIVRFPLNEADSTATSYIEPHPPRNRRHQRLNATRIPPYHATRLIILITTNLQDLVAPQSHIYTIHCDNVVSLLALSVRPKLPITEVTSRYNTM